MIFPKGQREKEDVEQMDSLFPYEEKIFLHLAKIINWPAIWQASLHT